MMMMATTPVAIAIIANWKSQAYSSPLERAAFDCRGGAGRTTAVAGGRGCWWRGATDGSGSPRTRSETACESGYLARIQNERFFSHGKLPLSSRAGNLSFIASFKRLIGFGV